MRFIPETEDFGVFSHGLYKGDIKIYQLCYWKANSRIRKYTLALHLDNQPEDEFVQLLKWDLAMWNSIFTVDNYLFSYKRVNNDYICTFTDDNAIRKLIHNEITIKQFKDIIQTLYGGVLFRQTNKMINTLTFNDGTVSFIINGNLLYDSNLLLVRQFACRFLTFPRKHYHNLQNPPFIIDTENKKIYECKTGKFNIINNDIIQDYISHYSFNITIIYCENNLYLIESQDYHDLLLYSDENANIRLINAYIPYSNIIDEDRAYKHGEMTPYIRYRNGGIVNEDGMICDIYYKYFDI